LYETVCFCLIIDWFSDLISLGQLSRRRHELLLQTKQLLEQDTRYSLPLTVSPMEGPSQTRPFSVPLPPARIESLVETKVCGSLITPRNTMASGLSAPNSVRNPFGPTLDVHQPHFFAIMKNLYLPLLTI
jgi:hypothetical protein